MSECFEKFYNTLVLSLLTTRKIGGAALAPVRCTSTVYFGEKSTNSSGALHLNFPCKKLQTNN
jgi:hypothetical protein